MSIATRHVVRPSARAIAPHRHVVPRRGSDRAALALVSVLLVVCAVLMTMFFGLLQRAAQA